MELPAQTDRTTAIQDLRAQIREFVAERDWEKYHHPKNLAMSIAIEAAELMEHFQWLSADECQAEIERPETRAQVEDELADVLIYALAFANATGTDISQIVRRKMGVNQKRFPASEVHGTLGRGDGRRRSTP